MEKPLATEIGGRGAGAGDSPAEEGDGPGHLADED